MVQADSLPATATPSPPSGMTAHAACSLLGCTQIIDAIRKAHKAKGNLPTSAIFTGKSMTVADLAAQVFPGVGLVITQPHDQL